MGSSWRWLTCSTRPPMTSRQEGDWRSGMCCAADKALNRLQGHGESLFPVRDLMNRGK